LKEKSIFLSLKYNRGTQGFPQKVSQPTPEAEFKEFEPRLKYG